MSFNNNIQRIGFACKFSEVDPKNGVISVPEYNCKTTTIAWLDRQPKRLAYEKLISIAKHNASSIRKVVQHLSTLSPELRMFRISSDIFPAYTHDDYTGFWHDSDTQTLLERMFSSIGELARKNDVRLSFHPDQFVVLASEREEVVNKSIQEFEYHVDIARFMGYGKTFQDMKINVHISGKKGPQGIIDVLPRLSTEAVNTITIENDEISWGLDSSLELANHVALVLDIHHHYIKTGEYIDPNDDRVKRVIDSWRGIRPVIHYSLSKEDGVLELNTNQRHDLNTLLANGYNKQKLRAHSDYFYNHAANEWAASFNDKFDIMAEAKAKNLASFAFYEKYRKGKTHVQQT